MVGESTMAKKSQNFVSIASSEIGLARIPTIRRQELLGDFGLSGLALRQTSREISLKWNPLNLLDLKI
jgi:hypothetical protein